MPTLQELAASAAKLDALLLAESAPTEKTVELSPAAATQQIAAEMQKADLSAERRKYLSDKLTEIAKVNSEGTNTSISIKIIDDPLRQKEQTVSSPTLQNLPIAKPDSTFASNLKTVIGKAELITKLLADRDALRKSKMSDKLEDIQKLFGLSDDDMKDTCNVSWKVSDLVSQLARAVQLEAFVEKAGGGVAKETIPETVWPDDMARAKFDPVAKGYQKPDLTWGYDESGSRR